MRLNKKTPQTHRTAFMQAISRIPPIRIAEKTAATAPAAPAREFEIVYEDDALLVINKPAGVAVHGGSGVSFGVIEQLRRAPTPKRVI